jgi:hypothetical protein
MSCVEIPITIVFDKKRRFEASYPICPDTDISQLAEKIAEDIANSWAQKMGVKKEEAIEKIREGVALALDMYLTGIIFELYGQIEEAYQECESGLITSIRISASDGYEEDGRSLMAVVETEFTCEEISALYHALMEMLATPFTRTEMKRLEEELPGVAEAIEKEALEKKGRLMYVEDRLYRALPEPAKQYYRTVTSTYIPYRDLKRLLERLVNANIWFTIYRTTNS